MAIYRVQVTLNNDSGLAEDQVVNTFHVSGDIAGDEVAVGQEFIDFYASAAPGAGNTVMARMSSQLDGSGRIRIYNLADPKPRVPVLDQAFSGKIPGGTALPPEVACCLSFKAAPAAGVNAARRRNRVYIGPLAQSALASNTDPSIATAFRTDLMLALQKAKTDIEAVTGGLATLVGYSPTDGVTWPIASAWVDDAADTQRRRGKAPLTRSSQAIV